MRFGTQALPFTAGSTAQLVPPFRDRLSQCGECGLGARDSGHADDLSFKVPRRL
jgi:hypothetical protein